MPPLRALRTRCSAAEIAGPALLPVSQMVLTDRPTTRTETLSACCAAQRSDRWDREWARVTREGLAEHGYM